MSNRTFNDEVRKQLETAAQFEAREKGLRYLVSYDIHKEHGSLLALIKKRPHRMVNDSCYLVKVTDPADLTSDDLDATAFIIDVFDGTWMKLVKDANGKATWMRFDPGTIPVEE